MDPWSWLPATAWEDPEIRAYVPSTYQVTFFLVEDPGPEQLDQLTAQLPAAVADLVDTKQWDRDWALRSNVHDRRGSRPCRRPRGCRARTGRAVERVPAGLRIRVPRREPGHSGAHRVQRFRSAGDVQRSPAIQRRRRRPTAPDRTLEVANHPMMTPNNAMPATPGQRRAHGHTKPSYRDSNQPGG